MRIALSQVAGTRGDIDANLDLARNVVARAADRGVGLVVFPECFLAGYYNPDSVERLARPVDGPALGALARIAAESRVAVACGYYERDGDRVHNSLVLMGAGGRRLANYRKRFLFGPWERSVFAPGGEIALAEVQGIRIGLLICYDVEFPEAVRALARAGAQLVVVATALMKPAGVIPGLLVPARAAENQIFVAYANRSGREDHLDFVGESRVVGPDGREIARAGAAEEPLLVADLDIAAIARARAEACYLDDLERFSAPVASGGETGQT